MAESAQDMISRLEGIAAGGATWDLSDNDMAAIRFALDEMNLAKRMLWLNHGHVGLYGDDGEMQCGACGVDFKRMTFAEIEASWMKRSEPGIAALLDALRRRPA